MLEFRVYATELVLAPTAKSAMLIEASTKTILFEKNIHEKYAPASMTKMMSMLLIMEAINKGSMDWNDQVRISINASNMGGSQIFLEENERMTVRDLFQGIAISSANDATVALAEQVAGTEQQFVALMNERGKQLGLKNTHFMNAHGLDEKDHYSTAFDMLLIAKELIRYKEVLQYSKIYETYLRANTDRKTWLVNTNKLVHYYDGVDGLKTGNTDEAGYCLTVTAKRNGMRLIGVVFGEPDSTTRNKEVSELLDYGFNSYQVEQYLSTKEKVGSTVIEKGKTRRIDVVPVEDVTILFKKAVEKKSINYQLVVDEKKTKAPIKRGQLIGEIKMYENGNYNRSVGLTVIKDVKKSSFFTLYFRSVFELLSGKLEYYL